MQKNITNIMVEFRLYYDDTGNILCYTCDKLEGNFLVIDAQTYAECRFDLKVLDGQLVNLNKLVAFKLVPSTEGTKCAIEDNAIVVNDDYTGPSTSWKLKIYEFR